MQLKLFSEEATTLIQSVKKVKKNKLTDDISKHINPTCVYLREQKFGYQVMNVNDFKFNPARGLIRSWGFQVMKNYNQTKDDFIREVCLCYGVMDYKWTKKLENEDGTFILDGVEVKYQFRTDYFSHDGKPSTYPAPHLEFRTAVPTIISETGYRSEFLNLSDLDSYNSIKDIIDELILSYREKK